MRKVFDFFQNNSYYHAKVGREYFEQIRRFKQCKKNAVFKKCLSNFGIG